MSNPQESVSYSHPDNPVRHNYPLSVSSDGLTTAMGLYLKTSPLIILRAAILAGFTIVSVIWFGIIYGLGTVASHSGNQVGLWAVLIGCGIPVGFFLGLKRYVLLMLEMAHVAVLTRLITHGQLEPGVNQIEYGKDAVTTRFGEVNLLLALQGLIQAVVRGFTNTLNWLTGWLPIPGLEGVMGLVGKVLRNATGYVEDAIFSYNLARGDENQWRSSKDGLIYYAQNWEPVLKTAVYALVLEYVLSGIAFLVFLVPCMMLSSTVPRLGGALVFAAVLMAVSLKSAVLRPLFSTMVTLTFHKAIQNQPINPQLDQTLSSASDKFRELAERAKNWVAGSSQTVPMARA